MDAKDQLINTEELIGETPTGLKRELDSMDDFEHLSEDNLKEKPGPLISENSELSDLRELIDKRVETNEGAVHEVKTSNLPESQGKSAMDSYIFEQGDSFPTARDAEEKLDRYLQEMHKDQFKELTSDFVENEKGWNDSLLFEAGDSSSPVKKVEENVVETFGSVENLIDDFRDVKDEFEPLARSRGETPLPEEKIEEILKPEKIVEVKKEPVKGDAEGGDSKEVIEAEVFFCKMGLDTWFNPEKLNPKVEGLIYWRDPKKSGPVFGAVLLVLLALTYFSLISVVAYLSLLGLTGTISFRIYKNVVQAVQKTGDGHPFKEFLEFDLTLPPEKVNEITQVGVAHVNAGIAELRRLFLVEDLIDSIKFGVFMWTLTYLGAWFNGMTLVILAWVALFTLPKVYETNKTQIDANLEVVKAKLAELTSKVKAAIPIGKKEEKKEQ